MMLDADIVAVSPSSVWRVLGQAGLLAKWKGKPSKKGTGFEQPLQPHQHWHIDVSYINISGHVLLSVQRAGRLQPLHRALGSARVDDGGRDRDHSASEPRRSTRRRRPRIISDNGPQFIARDFKEFIRISGMTHVQNLAVLPAIEREDRTLAQIAQGRVHPAGNAVDAGGCAAADSAVRGPLQHRAPAQRDRLHHARRHAGRAAGGDPCGARSQAGGGAPAAAKAPAAGGDLKMRATMTLPGETEAGSAGMQPCRGIAWWAHRDDVLERGGSPFALFPKTHRIGRPSCLENPRPEGAEYSLTENASSPFHAEPEHPQIGLVHFLSKILYPFLK